MKEKPFLYILMKTARELTKGVLRYTWLNRGGVKSKSCSDEEFTVIPYIDRKIKLKAILHEKILFNCTQTVY